MASIERAREMMKHSINMITLNIRLKEVIELLKTLEVKENDRSLQRNET